MATSAVLTGFEHHIPLREVARSDDLDASILGPLDSTCHSSHCLPVPVQKHQVDLVIHAIQGVVLDLVPSPPSLQSRGSDGQKCRCKLKIHLGSEIHETEWAELRKDSPLPGSPQETWGAVWEQNGGPLTHRMIAWNVPEKVVVDLFIEGLYSQCLRACLRLGAEKQHWAFDQGGLLEAQISSTILTASRSNIPSRASSQEDIDALMDSLSSLPAHGQVQVDRVRSRANSTVSPAGPPPKCYDKTADGGNLLERLHALFVFEEELEEVMVELRRIHLKVYEKGRRQSVTHSHQPVMSWKAFQDSILLEDLPNLAHGRAALNVFIVQQALLGDAVPTTSATKALLLAYGKNRKPATKHDVLVHGITALSTVSILSSFILLGISLDNDSDWPVWLVFEAVFACIFVGEIVIKSVVYTAREYFFGPSRWWNRFDVLLTAVAVIELILNLFSVSGGQAKLVLILRGLRLARVARLAKLVNMPLLQELANIVSGFIISVRSLFWVVLTINVVVYVCALALRSLVQSFTTALFRDTCNQSGDTLDMETNDYCSQKIHLVYGEEYCGSVLRCMFSIFRCMIGDCTSAGARTTNTHNTTPTTTPTPTTATATPGLCLVRTLQHHNRNFC